MKESLEKILENFEGSNFSFNLNTLLIPVSTLQPTIENAEFFNKILQLCKTENLNKIIRTRQGSISKKVSNLKIPCYDLRGTKYSGEITIIGINCKMYRIQFRARPKINKEDSIMSGHKAFLGFKKHTLKFGINLEDYAINNGKEIKKEIETYMIESYNSVVNITWKNVHHIDFHSSFPAGLVNTHPEFKKCIEDLYNKRKIKPEYKLILNSTIGYFQSEYCGYKYTQLSKDAINDNNKRLRNIVKRLEESGRIILALNTDGVWYCGKIYHGEGEGKELGQWENDHINCQWRAKSAGCYEYIENNKYIPVVRGATLLDREKDRENWSWGDIFKTQEIKFKLTDEGFKYETAQ